MKSRVLSVALLAGVICASAAIPPVQAAPRYGVCREQLRDFVERQLGQTVTRIEIQSYAEGNPKTLGSALVFVKECNGFHGFAIHGSMTVCEHIPHYGKTIGAYFHYEGGFKGCKRR